MSSTDDILRIAQSLQTLIKSLAIVDETAATRLDKEFSRKLVVAVRLLYADLAARAAKEFARPRKYPHLQNEDRPIIPTINNQSVTVTSPFDSPRFPNRVGAEELPAVSRFLPITPIEDITAGFGGTEVTNRGAQIRTERANPAIKRIKPEDMDEESQKVVRREQHKVEQAMRDSRQ